MNLLQKLKAHFFLAIAVLLMGSSVAQAKEIDAKVLEIVEGMRAGFREVAIAAGTPDKVAEIKRTQVSASNPERKIAARLYVPLGVDTKKKLPIVIFVHGGGFVSGDLDSYETLVSGIANGAGALVLAMDYRLAPEHPYPAGLEDIYASLLWVVDHAKEIGADTRRIAVAGDSAGGNLATELAMLTRDRHGPKLIAQWLMYPTVSNKMDTASWKELGNKQFLTPEINAAVIAAYVPEGMSPYAPGVAPLWGVHKNLPPALLQVGDADPLHDETHDYAKALKAAGVKAEITVYKGAVHGFIQTYKNKAQSPDGEKALNEGVAFLKSRFKPGAK